MSQNQTQRFPLVDLLRGFAALLVVFYHVLVHRPWPNFDITGIGKLPMMGWVGVDLFLVISGFVIGKTAMDGHDSGLPWRQRYIHRRITRIVPLYLATLIIWVILVNPALLTYGLASAYHIVTHLGFVHKLWHETHGSINPPPQLVSRAGDAVLHVGRRVCSVAGTKQYLEDFGPMGRDCTGVEIRFDGRASTGIEYSNYSVYLRVAASWRSG